MLIKYSYQVSQLTVLKCTNFMALIDGVFCLDTRVMYERETL